jgi:hypothetical protein
MFSRRYRGIWFAGLVLGALALIWFVPARMDDQLPRKIGPQPDGTILVPTNQLLSPAGLQLYFPGRPVDLALSPDRSLLAIKNMEGILLVRMKDRTILQTLPVPTGGQGFVGILFAPDGKSIYTTDIWNDYRNGTRKVTIRAGSEVATLLPYLCPTFIGFPSVMQDVYRAQEFIKELREFEAKGQLPNFFGTAPHAPWRTL